MVFFCQPHPEESKRDTPLKGHVLPGGNARFCLSLAPLQSSVCPVGGFLKGLPFPQMPTENSPCAPAGTKIPAHTYNLIFPITAGDVCVAVRARLF